MMEEPLTVTLGELGRQLRIETAYSTRLLEIIARKDRLIAFYKTQMRPPLSLIQQLAEDRQWLAAGK